MTADQKDTVSTQEAAQLLGVSRITVTRLIERGLLIGYKLTPKRNSPYRITKASIEHYKETYRPK